MQAVDPSQKELTQDIAIGYYSADIFLTHLKKAGNDLSRAKFLTAANDGSTYEVPGRSRQALVPDQPLELGGLRLPGPDQRRQVHREGAADLLQERPLSVLGS